MQEIVKTDFLLNKMYDTSENPLIRSFMPCEHSALRRQYTTIFAFNYVKCHHRILETCKLQRIPYFTCIEYKENVECVERHVCDIFPVHVGMNLDRQIYEFLYGADELNLPEVQKTMYDLYGTIYVVSPQYFSNIFTNRKEIIHSSKELDKLYNIYMYDIYDRGHRIWLTSDTNKTCIFRNSNGVEHVIGNTPSFHKFISTVEYEVDIRKHIDFTRMYQAFIRFRTKTDIDDLTNKNILCCINLLQRGLKYAQRNPTEVCKIFRFGSLDKFASRNIAYHTKESKTNINSNAVVISTTIPLSTSSSSSVDINANKPNLKRPKPGASTSSQEEQQKSQMVNMMNSNSAGPAGNSDYSNLAQNYKTLSPTNLVHSIDSYDRHIKRPVPKNVHTIPTGTEFFICLADTQLNVNSPHKWLRLLPHVILTNHLIIKYSPGLNNLNDVLDTLLQHEYITTEEGPIMILVNGGIPTRYCLSNKIDVVDFFFVCKSMCPFIECVIAITEGYIVLSLTYGVPMRPVSMHIIREFWTKADKFCADNIYYEEDVLYLSPLDMKNTFLQSLRKFLYGNLLGGGCPENMRKYFKYSIPAKVHSVYTFNNRFISNLSAMPYYDLTCENSFVFMNNVYREKNGQREELLNRKDSTINLKTIYSSDPHLTCDGYILSDKVKMDTVMKQKCRFEFELHTKTDKLIWSRDLPSFGNTSNGQIKVYDAHSNCIKTYYLIFTLVRYSKCCLRYKLFNQAKISLFCYPFNDGWIYRLYKYYDEEAFILPNADYEMSVIFTTPVDRKFIKNISIMICTTCKQPERFSGQKLYEICGQKGLCIQQSTERFKKYYDLPDEPDLVVSLFSAIGRTPIMTLKTMVDNLTPDEQRIKQRILYGDCEYVLLKNISSLFCSYGNMRVDISLVKIFLANNLNLTIYLLQQDSKNNGRVLPKSFCESLGFYGLIKVNFIMYDEFGKEYNVFVNTFKQNTY
ncbi:late expression factor 8 (LEF 8) [Drosophila suzukii associated hytrosavirus 1]|nr:late expression factor 8 (LEF 8) [Drosophila suzukii associated hytrosavirus 1]